MRDGGATTPIPPTTPSSERFRPAPWLSNRHLQTVAPLLWPSGPEYDGVEPRIVEVDDAAAVAVKVEPVAGHPRGTLLLVHGIGGSADSGYMRRTARVARRSGWTTVRMSCRNAGGTERLSRTLSNAGQSDDIGRVLATLDDWSLPRPFAVAGFSLGGNMVLRYAGLAGTESLADAVAAVNPPVDLEVCSRTLLEWRNRPYSLFFTYGLCAQIRKIRRHRPVAGPPARWWNIRTVWRFDELFVAPDAGHPSAEAYYAAASSGPRLEGLRVPALVLSAEDDPFIPAEIFEPYRKLATNGLVLDLVRRGGHLGYWNSESPRFWAATAVLDFFDSSIFHVTTVV